MKRILSITALVALALPAGAVEQDRVVDLQAGGFVTAMIENKPVKLRVDFDAPANVVMLNPATVERIRIRGFHTEITANADAQWFKMMRAPVQFEIGSRWEKRIVYWSEKQNVIDGADGIIGPMVLPENEVTYRIHAPVAGEKTIEMPVHVDGVRVGNSVKLGKWTVAISFAPQKAQSVATAAAGSWLADIRDGHWAGPATTVQAQTWLEPARARPARLLKLGRPLSLSGLPLRQVMIRTADYRGTFMLPADEAPARTQQKADPDEILVVGKSRTPQGGEGVLQLALGQDALGRCSSITLDRRQRMMTLSCLAS